MDKRKLVRAICCILCFIFIVVVASAAEIDKEGEINSVSLAKISFIFPVEYSPIEFKPAEDEPMAINKEMLREMVLLEEGPMLYVEPDPPCEVEPPAETPTEVPIPETSPEAEAPTHPAPAPSYPVYSVDGHVLDENIQKYFYEKLCAAGIGWWMPYALCTAYQESRFDLYAENKNGLDKGLLQYRTTYWNWANDIFNPYAQIDIYVSQNANRLNNMGLDIPSTISRHQMSDWGPYNQEYVDQVMQWVSTLNQIK